MSSPAMQAASLLVDAGVAYVGEAPEGSTAYTVQIGRLTDSPHALIALYDTGGLNTNPVWLLEQPTIQAIIRSPVGQFSNGWAKGIEVKDVLLGMNPKTVDGDNWDGVNLLSNLTFIGYDDNNRAQFSINFRLFWEPAASALTSRKPLSDTGP